MNGRKLPSFKATNIEDGKQRIISSRKGIFIIIRIFKDITRIIRKEKSGRRERQGVRRRARRRLARGRRRGPRCRQGAKRRCAPSPSPSPSPRPEDSPPPPTNHRIESHIISAAATASRQNEKYRWANYNTASTGTFIKRINHPGIIRRTF